MSLVLVNDFLLKQVCSVNVVKGSLGLRANIYGVNKSQIRKTKLI